MTGLARPSRKPSESVCRRLRLPDRPLRITAVVCGWDMEVLLDVRGHFDRH
jgi:hypothetical protein